MIAVVGASGKVGFSTASTLRKADVPVRAILRDATKGERLREIGCEIGLADIQDARALAEVLSGTDAVQVILPLTPQAPDPAADMRQSVASVIKALGQADTKQILAISDYGAHVIDDIGIPGIFRDFEGQLKQLPGRKTILRTAEHMQNWGREIPKALESGSLLTLQNPVDVLHPTISAYDLGVISANLLLRPAIEDNLAIVHAEGPRRYSANDVATALSQLSNRNIEAKILPRSRWNETIGRNTRSTLTALVIRTGDAKNAGGLIDIEPNVGPICYGTTELVDALRPLIPR